MFESMDSTIRTAERVGTSTAGQASSGTPSSEQGGNTAPFNDRITSGTPIAAQADGSLLLADARLVSATAELPAQRFSSSFARPDYPAHDALRFESFEFHIPAMLSPSLRRQSINMPRHDFIDKGPGTYKFSMNALDVDALRSVAGGKVQLVIAEDEQWQFLGEGRLAWLSEYLQTETGVTPFFAPGDKGIFAVQGFNYGANWAMLGWGLKFQVFDGLTASAGYDAQATGQQMYHIGSGTLKFVW
jgi:hypothetical protein